MADFPTAITSLTRPTSSDPGTGGGATDATVIVDKISDEVEAIETELGTSPSGASATVAARLDALDTTVGAKADTSAVAELARDAVGSALVAGSNVTITVDDAGNTITIASTASGGVSAEEVMDAVATMLTAGSNISLTYNDAGDTLTIAVTGLGTAAALSTSDIDERARDAVGTALTAGSGITITPNDGADTITIAATGGGGTSWSSAAGVPATSTGSTGDFYRNTTTSDYWKSETIYGPKGSVSSVATTNRRRLATYAKITTASAHGLTAGDLVEVAGMGGTGYNGTWVVYMVPTSTTFIVKTSTSGAEASTADTGGTVTKGWGKGHLLRRPPSFVWDESAIRPSPSGWARTLSYSSTASTAVEAPFVIVGSSNYIVGYDTSTLTGASTTGEAYAFFCPNEIAPGTTFWAGTTIYAPTEAGAKAGLVLGDGQTGQFGIEINLRNDNKLYVDSNFMGTVTNIWTSTTTASSGVIALHKRGAILEVVASSWGCDLRTPLSSSYATMADVGVFVKNSTTGRVNVNTLFTMGA